MEDLVLGNVSQPGCPQDCSPSPCTLAGFRCGAHSPWSILGSDLPPCLVLERLSCAGLLTEGIPVKPAVLHLFLLPCTAEGLGKRLIPVH